MKCNKHAYLVVAHNQQDLLKKLLIKIDSTNNDIFLHIDKKYVDCNIESLKNIVNYSNIYFLDRRNIGWGAFSQINLTLDLLEVANKNYNYSYYHLISGVDFPIKDIDYIYNFFEDNNRYEYISYDNKIYNHKYDERIKYYWILQEYERKNKFLKILNRGLVIIQKIIGVNRTKNINVNFQKGANWFSITNDFVNYLLQKREWISKYFKYSHCADEIFLQTLLENSKFKKNLYKKGINDGNLRLVDWERGNPYIWKKEDKELLLNSKYLWARKFDIYVDCRIIDLLVGNGEYNEKDIN